MARTSWVTIGLLALLWVALPACGTKDETAEPHSPGAGTESKLILDNGKKWQVDEHTSGMFSKMHKSVDGFAGTSAKEISALGMTLEGQLKELIAGCTMKGKAHDHLHILLGEFMPAVHSLAKESAVDEAKKNMERVKHLLTDYDKHFE